MLRMGLIVAVAVAGVSFAAPAQAFHCPQDMAAIDAALPNANLSDEDKAKLQELRQQGEELHEAGNHAESIKVLGEAKKLLGL